MKWEQIDSDHARAKIKGGWLVKSFSHGGICMCFVPDPMHGWVL